MVLPGCNVGSPENLTAWLHQPEMRSVRDWLVEVAPTARLIACGCVGTFVMGATGLRNGRSATTTWWLTREFQRLYPQVKLDMKRIVVDEGKYLTAGAAALAQIDLMLSVVRHLCSEEVARQSASFMLADERQHLTPRTLARRFIEATGTPPYHFVQRVRLERAHQLLQTTAEPLQRIAEAVGYQNASTLSRAFKRFDFPNPAALRRSVRR